MPFIEAPTTFYLGRRYDPEASRLLDEVVYYDSRDLTTHAVVVGMTGSGKTGMCVTLLEEAVLDNIPAIVIDPKGDITNLMLLFPELKPADFAPWVNASDAQRAGMDTNEFAQDVAQQWRDGLASWSIVPQRIAALKQAAQFSIYTPGSDAGLPISILASLQAPKDGWVGHEEFHREQISGVVRALMALIGKQVDPVKDREHVLISNIFEEAWKAGKDLTLEDIILQVQNPPFQRLGVFDVNTFFPEKDRFKLAKELNNIIASPSFQTWINGEPLDMRRLLYTAEGRPRVSIFYLAHLTDAERTFIITLILENMLAWMRTLSGTTSLRAMLYFDEVFGHFPPAPRNPPTKEPLLRLLKQARAFGIGTILATQNPGDLDYKGLSNAGTWFIGKLQTDNDKKRVLGGLEAATTANSKLDIGKLDNLISGLAPRVFMLHNVHDDGGPILMHSRWSMSYLRGPLTRQQVRALMEQQRHMIGLDVGQMPVQSSGRMPAVQVAQTSGQPRQATASTPSAVPPAAPASPAKPGPQSANQYTPTPSQPVAPPVLPGEKPPTAVGTGISKPVASVPPPLPETPESKTNRTPVTPPPAPPEQSAHKSTTQTPPPLAPDETADAPASGGGIGSFFDRLSKSAAQPAQPEQEFQPSRPFGFSNNNTPSKAQPPVKDSTEPAVSGNTAGSFWLTPTAEDQPPAMPVPPSKVEDDSTMPVGVGANVNYVPPRTQGTRTERGPALPDGYDERPPVLPSSVAQYYLPTTITTDQAVRQWEQRMGLATSVFGGASLLYQPVLLAQLGVRYLDRKSNAETDQHWAFHVPNVDASGFVRWNENLASPVPVAQLGNQPFGQAAYGLLSAGLTDAKRLKSLRDEVIDYVARSASLTLYYNPDLDLYGKPGEDQRDFISRATQVAREGRDQEIDEVTARYEKAIDQLELRLRREERQLNSDKQVLDELKREDLYTTGEAVMSLMRGKTAYTLSRMSRARRYKKQAQERAIGGEQDLIALEEQIEAKQKELQNELQAINAKWAKTAQAASEYKVKPFKKDIAIEAFGIGWVPMWYVVLNSQQLVLPAFVSSTPQQ